MSRAKVKAEPKILDPFEQKDLEEAKVMALFDDGKPRYEIADRLYLPVARVREIVKRKMAERSNKFRGPLPKLVAAERLDRIAAHALKKADLDDTAPADSARLYATAIDAQEVLNKVLGLNAPIRTSNETVVSSTVIRREEHLLLMRDPELRELQSQMDQHVINIRNSEADDPGRVRAPGFRRPMGLPAPSGDDEPEDDGAGQP